MHTHFKLFALYLKPHWQRALLLTFLVLGGIALQLVNPQIIRYVLDQAAAGATQPQLLLAASLFIAFSLLQAGMTLASTWLGTDLGWTAMNNLRADLALHCLRLDMGFHNSHTPGELLERVDGDVNGLSSFFSRLVIQMIASLLLVTGVILLLFREDWRMGLAAALYAGVVLAFLQIIQGRAIPLWQRARATEADLSSLLEERLSGREDVRANGGEGYVLRGLAQAQGARFRAYYPARMVDVITFSGTQLFLILATVLGLGIGIFLYRRGQITIGTIYLITYYIALLQEPLNDFRRLMHEMQAASGSILRVDELFARQPAIRQQPGKTHTALPRSALPMEFSGVSFHYASHSANRNGASGDRADSDGDELLALPPSVLDDISFTLAPNRVLGLLGRTGSGKTTLTRLLVRLYDPTSGEIRLDGTALQGIGLRDLRQRVGMVTQEVQLFQGSLRDNITLFNRSIDDATILDALQALGLWSWFSAQADGLDTRLQAGSGGLSAGEAQLLAFVRIFLKDPGLVILDEASSRLDPATEQLLERAIDRLLRGRTAIVIAHRLETVERADEILILENGRLLEHGERVALRDNPNSRFAHLLRSGLQETLA
ncbi:MAG: ABC transporter ATP-binding protein [Caldilineaceae bacterium]|nr:ABC transporter ATP-binding protein [Caldilineaceae bacterium]